jgi:hypothetical protein
MFGKRTGHHQNNRWPERYRSGRSANQSWFDERLTYELIDARLLDQTGLKSGLRGQLFVCSRRWQDQKHGPAFEAGG